MEEIPDGVPPGDLEMDQAHARQAKHWQTAQQMLIKDRQILLKNEEGFMVRKHYRDLSAFAIRTLIIVAALMTLLAGVKLFWR